MGCDTRNAPICGKSGCFEIGLVPRLFVHRIGVLLPLSGLLVRIARPLRAKICDKLRPGKFVSDLGSLAMIDVGRL